MNFQTLLAQNIGPYERARLDLSGRGLTLVTGRTVDAVGADSNGAGKSSLFTHAVPWTLYGTTAPVDSRGGIKGGNVGRDSAPGQPVVGMISAVTDSGAQVVIGRSYNGAITITDGAGEFGLKVTKKSGKRSLILVVDGVDESHAKPAVTQDKIDALIGMDWTSFTRTTIFSQDGRYDFASSGDAERKTLLASILDLGAIDLARERAKADVALAGVELGALTAEWRTLLSDEVRWSDAVAAAKGSRWAAENAQRLGVAKGDLTSILRQISKVRDSLTALPEDTNNTDLRDQLARVEVKTREYRAEAQAVRDAYETTRAEYNARLGALENMEALGWPPDADPWDADWMAPLETFIRGLQPQRDSAQARLTEAHAAVDKAAESIRSIRPQRDAAAKAAKAAREQAVEVCEDSACPTCKRGMDTGLLGTVMGDLEAVYNAHAATAAGAEESLRGWECYATEAGGIRDESAKIATDLTAQISHYAAQIKGWVGQQLVACLVERDRGLAGVEDRAKAHTDESARIRLAMDQAHIMRSTRLETRMSLQSAQGQQEVTEARIQALTDAVDPSAGKLEMAQHELDRIATRRGLIREAQEDAERRSLIAGWWVQGFGPKGLKAQIIEGVLADLEGLVNEWLAILTDGTIRVEIAGQRKLASGGESDEISLTVHGADFARPYRQWSGGERRRVSTAINIGFADFVARRAGVRHNFLVLDEVLANLDATGRDRARTLLGKLAGSFSSVFVIEHDTDLKGLFENVLTVERRGGVSRLLGVADEV